MHSYEASRVPSSGAVVYANARIRNPKKKPSNKFKAAFQHHKYYWTDYVVRRGKPGGFTDILSTQPIGYWKCYEDKVGEVGRTNRYKFIWAKEELNTKENIQWLVNAHADNFGGLIYIGYDNELYRVMSYSTLEREYIHRNTLMIWQDQTKMKVALQPTIDFSQTQEKHGL